MFLQEEYFRRVGVKTPYIKRIHQPNHLIFRRPDEKKFHRRWEVLTILPRKHDNGIEYYEVSTHAPYHNGWRQRDGMHCLDKNMVELEEYEDYLLFLSKELKNELLTDELEIMEGCWGMFLAFFDGGIADLPSWLLNKIAASVDASINIKDRNELIFAIEHCLLSNPTLCRNNFSQPWAKFKAFSQEYASWYARICQA